MIFVDLISLWFIRGLFALLNFFPVKGRIDIVEAILRAGIFFIPSYKEVSLKNLERVYPNESKSFHQETYFKSIREIARLIIDFGRLTDLDKKWVDENVTIDEGLFKKLRSETPHRPILYAAGHLGSFELMAHVVALKGYPVNFIVRNFELPYLDEWWTRKREHNGNKIIPRKGAVQKMLQLLSDGKDCALLFDQNVKSNYALFVPWFGTLAATTFTLGLAAVKSEAHVLAISLKYNHDINKYELITSHVECSEIYRDESLSKDDKILEVTKRASAAFEKHILGFPEGWFWMHRRWKTRPQKGLEDNY